MIGALMILAIAGSQPEVYGNGGFGTGYLDYQNSTKVVDYAALPLRKVGKFRLPEFETYSAMTPELSLKLLVALKQQLDELKSGAKCVEYYRALLASWHRVDVKMGIGKRDAIRATLNHDVWFKIATGYTEAIILYSDKRETAPDFDRIRRQSPMKDRYRFNSGMFWTPGSDRSASIHRMVWHACDTHRWPHEHLLRERAQAVAQIDAKGATVEDVAYAISVYSSGFSMPSATVDPDPEGAFKVVQKGQRKFPKSAFLNRRLAYQLYIRKDKVQALRHAKLALQYGLERESDRKRMQKVIAECGG